MDFMPSSGTACADELCEGKGKGEGVDGLLNRNIDVPLHYYKISMLVTATAASYFRLPSISRSTMRAALCAACYS